MSQNLTDPLLIAGRTFSSRLLVGTGKYKDMDETRAAVDASGAEIVTIAVRRTNLGQNTEAFGFQRLGNLVHCFVKTTIHLYTESIHHAHSALPDIDSLLYY